MNLLSLTSNYVQRVDSMASATNKVDSLRTELIKLQAENNSEIIKQASTTIEYQSELISSFGTIYTILTILIAIIAVGLPIVVYQFGIKPSKDALKQLENNLDEKVAIYLSKNRSQQIAKSIKDLGEDDAELKAQAISFLSLTLHEGFTDQEMFEFNRLIKSGKLSDSHLGSIAYLLGSRVNEYANDIFSDAKYLKNNNLKVQAFQYISKIGLDNFMEPVLELFKKTDNQYGEFINLLTFVNINSKSEALKVFNNKELIDILSDETLKNIGRTIENSIKHMNINIDLKETYLKKVCEKASV
ncbi:hypothetical protein [Marinirhabdus gelatinilytica]|uniref:Uncharacterized protein n=1 Tax=Marinirhabdus gelatinilytica TaxID=1703343 RepID=A0A370Q342_9FLAO|nr:hypothetical protein [Marinirhabdus gelatinilytica]RDK82785.1 hypothetical protein C8D94_1125 [Marinirhabdus gelatinilytica]